MYHAYDRTFLTYLRQHFHYGQGAFCFREARARCGQRRVKVAPPAFYFNMLRCLFVSVQGVNPLILMLLLIVTQFVNAAGFF